jgi:uncharacterized protein (DUF849 family)
MQTDFLSSVLLRATSSEKGVLCMFFKACLNGSCERGSHPTLPITPEELARDAAAAVAAEAQALHVHPRDATGRPSLVLLPRLLRGTETATWPVLETALSPGFQTRIGLEDALKLPDGSQARGNAELVALAVQRAKEIMGW